MCRNLLTTVLTTGIIWVSAPAIAHPTPAVLSPVELPALQPASFSEHKKVNALHGVVPVDSAAPNPDTTQPVQAGSDWKGLTTLLTTLVLIGVIALRRYSAERP